MLKDLLRRFDRTRTVEIRYDPGSRAPAVPPSVAMEKNGDGFRLTYQPETLPTADLLTMLQQAGPIREMTVQSQNIDRLIADMYKELGL